MKFILQRLLHTSNNPQGDYTVSHLTNRENYNSFVIEDTFREVKVKGQTRIPSGFYELKIRKEDTPLTLKHRLNYASLPWFRNNPKWFHIEVTGITNYSGVYIHTGNDDSHTAGCLLPCFEVNLSKKDNPGAMSSAATDMFYSIVYPLLEAGTKVFIEVRDEQ